MDDKPKKMRLNFGSGVDYRRGYINMDYGSTNIHNQPIKFDVGHDFLKFPYPFKDNTFNYVLTRHVIEHFGRREIYQIFRELHRITKENGIIEIIVPYVSSSHSFHDPTHITYFSEETIRLFFCEFNIPNGFEVIKSDIILTNSFLRFLNFIPNTNKWTKKIYERCFMWSIPAQEMRVVVRVKKNIKGPMKIKKLNVKGSLY